MVISGFHSYTVQLIVLLSAFLTPGDFVWSTLAMAVPLYLLYELSVVASRAVWRSRASDAETVAALLAPILALRALLHATANPRGLAPRPRAS